MEDGRNSDLDCRFNQTIQHSRLHGGHQKSPEQSICLRHEEEIHDMMRLLWAIKCNHNPLEGGPSPRWLRHQPGSKGDLSADGPPALLLNPTSGDLLIQQRRCLKTPSCSFSRQQRVFRHYHHCSLAYKRGSMYVSHIWICPSVWIFFALFVLVCMCVHWQILVPAGLHLVFCPLLHLTVWGDKYLKSTGRPVSPAAVAWQLAVLH